MYVELGDNYSFSLDLNLVLHQLQIKQRELCQLSIHWTQAMVNLPADMIPDFSGPLQAHLAEAERVVTAELIEEPVMESGEEDGY